MSYCKTSPDEQRFSILMIYDFLATWKFLFFNHSHFLSMAGKGYVFIYTFLSKITKND